jgi:quinol monooxygenase YgiN
MSEGQPDIPSQTQATPFTFFKDTHSLDPESGFVNAIPTLPETDDFCVYGTIHAHPEHADALEAVYAETTRLSLSEPGTVYYCICRDGDDPTMFHMFERYRGKQGFDAHNAQPIIQKLVNESGYLKGVKARFAIPGLRSAKEQDDQEGEVKK